MREQKKESPTPVRRRWRRPAMFVVAWAGVAAACYCWGRYGTLSRAQAEPPAGSGSSHEVDHRPSDYSRRPVAWIHGNIAITREELGEYLITRFGKERLKNLINKRIIDHAAKQKGIEISQAEINAGLSADAAALGIDAKTFAEQLLKRYNKTLLEWKEDVIKPRLVMEKLSRSRVSVTPDDLTKAYEAHYGEKVDCKIIMWPLSERNVVLNKIWPLIRGSEQEFDHQARMQASPSLAAVGGHIKPIGRNSTGNDRLEKVLFNLRPGEVSEVIETAEGLVVARCLARIPPDTSSSFEQRRPALEKEVMEKKIALEIQKVFQELHAQAAPKNLMEPTSVTQSVMQQLQPQNAQGAPNRPGKAVPPAPQAAAPKTPPSSFPGLPAGPPK